MTTAMTQHEASTRSNWNTTLGELCDRFGGGIQTGPFGSQLHASDYSEHGTPVVMPQDLVNGRIVCDRIARVPEKIVRDLSRHALRVGDVVFSRRGDVTRFAVVSHEQEGWLCGTGCIRIRLNCPDVNIPFFRHYLQQNSVGKWLIHQAKGVTMPNLNTEIVRALPFVYPPLAVQQRIAAILDMADALRQKRRLTIQTLGSLVRSIFLEMFGDPNANPRNLPRRALKELIEVKSGDFLPAKLMRPGPFPVYGGNGITGFHDEFMFTNSQVVIGRVGVYCGVVHRTEPNAWITDNALYVAWRSPDLETSYLAAALQMANLNQFSGQMAQPLISGSRLYPVEILVPSLTEPQTFAERLEAHSRLEERFNRAEQNIDMLFRGLQDRLFEGEL